MSERLSIKVSGWNDWPKKMPSGENAKIAAAQRAPVGLRSCPQSQQNRRNATAQKRDGSQPSRRFQAAGER